MPPAHQRLDPEDRTAVECDLRLVVAEQLLLVDGCAQLADQGKAARVGAVDLGVVDLDGLPGQLGGIHRHVGPLQQQRTVDGVLRTAGHADRGANLQVDLVNAERCPQRALHQLGHDHHVVRVVADRNQQGELVTTEPGDRDPLGHAALEPSGNLLEQQVTAGVPKGVVDVLEPVEVEQQDGVRLVVPAIGQRVVDPLAEKRAVGEPGERVVVGVEGELVQQVLAAHGHLEVAGDHLQQVAFSRAERAHLAHPLPHLQGADGRAVRTSQRHHERVAHPRAPQPRREFRVVCAAGRENRLARGQHVLSWTVRRRCHRSGGRRVLAPGERHAARRGRKNHLGALGGQQGAGVLEQPSGQLFDGAAVAEFGGVVAHLADRAIAAQQSAVATVGKDRQRHEGQEQRYGAGVGLPDDDGQQSAGGRQQRAGDQRQQHRDDVAPGDGALQTHDGRVDQAAGQRRRTGRGGIGGRPAEGPGRSRSPYGREDCHRSDHLRREQREVEHRLVGRSPAQDGHEDRRGQPQGEQVGSVDQEQAKDQRHFRHRHRQGQLAHLDVRLVELTEHETDREQGQQEPVRHGSRTLRGHAVREQEPQSPGGHRDQHRHGRESPGWRLSLGRAHVADSGDRRRPRRVAEASEGAGVS